MEAHAGFTTLMALRAKAGELAALRALVRPAQVRRVQPLLQFDPGRKNPADQLADVEQIARHLHRLGRRCWIDASDVADQPGFGAGGALGRLADHLAGPADLLDEDWPVAFVPVVRSDATEQSAAALGRLGAELGAGAAVRIRPGTADRDTLGRIIERLGLEPGDIHIVVDLQYVAEATTARVEGAAAILTALAEVGTFGSTTLLTGSIPKTLGQTATWEQPRAEEVLWERLVRAGAGHLRFGDYGAVHPVPGPGFGSKHVALKYTCPHRWLYSRERMPDENGGEPARGRALRVVCRRVTESAGYAGPDFSWGDGEIHAVAAGAGTALGDTSKPVAFATSHHLAYLATRAASSSSPRNPTA
ncbi:beta family protein [Amycolatopsis sp. NPDC003731]